MSNAEHTMGDILARAIGTEVDALQIHRLEQRMPTVDRIMNRFDSQWRTTADACLQRAVELEEAAGDLRRRAEKLMAARELVDEVKGAVQFEIDARNRALSLVLVNPSE